MQWWQGFYGWLVTASLAAVAATVGLVQEVRRHRSRRAVALGIDEIGVLEYDRQKFHIFTVCSTSPMPLRKLHFTPIGAVGAHPDGDKYRIPRVLHPGREYKFAIETRDLSQAYVLFVVYPIQTRNGQVRWFPLDPDPEGPLWEEMDRQFREQGNWLARRWKRVRRGQLHVGPDGQLGARVRLSSKPRHQRRLFAILGIEEPTK